MGGHRSGAVQAKATWRSQLASPSKKLRDRSKRKKVWKQLYKQDGMIKKLEIMHQRQASRSDY